MLAPGGLVLRAHFVNLKSAVCTVPSASFRVNWRQVFAQALSVVHVYVYWPDFASYLSPEVVPATERVPRIRLLFGVDAPAALAAQRASDELGEAVVRLAELRSKIGDRNIDGTAMAAESEQAAEGTSNRVPSVPGACWTSSAERRERPSSASAGRGVRSDRELSDSRATDPVEGDLVGDQAPLRRDRRA
jgi:hypothetical protein